MWSYQIRLAPLAKVTLEGERDHRIDWVVRFHSDLELVRSFHALVHLGRDLQRSRLPWLDGRQTDDSLRRSAAFYDVYGWAFGESYRLGSRVPVRIGSFHGRVEGNSADVVYRLIEHET